MMWTVRPVQVAYSIMASSVPGHQKKHTGYRRQSARAVGTHPLVGNACSHVEHIVSHRTQCRPTVIRGHDLAHGKQVWCPRDRYLTSLVVLPSDKLWLNAIDCHVWMNCALANCSG